MSVIVRKGIGANFCNNTCYDPQTQDCCRGTGYNGTNWRECRSSCFNSHTQTCCNNSTGIKATGTYSKKKEIGKHADDH
ncbi:MAG TPA: hypothetical protein VMW77_00345 [Methanoregula sp.]|nr:hypothetical protein [Methanoregula sp.]